MTGRVIHVGAHTARSRVNPDRVHAVREYQRMAYRDPLPCPHPDRKILARGACGPCYRAWYRTHRREMDART